VIPRLVAHQSCSDANQASPANGSKREPGVGEPGSHDRVAIQGLRLGSQSQKKACISKVCILRGHASHRRASHRRCMLQVYITQGIHLLQPANLLQAPTSQECLLEAAVPKPPYPELCPRPLSHRIVSPDTSPHRATNITSRP